MNQLRNEKPEYQEGVFPKHCVLCGRSYSEAEWKELEYVGIYPGTVEGVGRLAPDMELRNCVCHSTLSAVLVEEDSVNV